MASDPHTYKALNIKHVVNCTVELPFVDEIADFMDAQALAKGLNPEGPGEPMMQKPINVELRVQLAGRLPAEGPEAFPSSVQYPSPRKSSQKRNPKP